MLQWFIGFPEFAEITEFNESSAPSRKISNIALFLLLVGTGLETTILNKISQLLYAF